MHEIFSDMPFMYGIVAMVVGVVLSLASVVVVGRCVLRYIFFRPLSKLYVSVLFVKVVVECVDFESIINVA